MDFKTVLEKTKESDLKLYTPLFNTKEVVIDKKENDYWLIPKRSRPVAINKTAYEIVQLCNGKNTLDEIINSIKEKYSSDLEVVRKDVIRTLYSLWNNTLIVWSKKNNYFQPLFQEFDKSTGTFYKVEQDNELIKKINETKDKAIISDKYDPDSMYTAININVRQNMKKEYYFSLTMDDKLKCIVCLEPIYTMRPLISNFSFHMEYFYFSEILENTEFDSFLTWCINWLKDYNGVYINAESAMINMQIEEGNNRYTDYIRILGFEFVGKFVKEYKNMDMHVYEKKLEL